MNKDGKVEISGGDGDRMMGRKGVECETRGAADCAICGKSMELQDITYSAHPLAVSCGLCLLTDLTRVLVRACVCDG